MYFIVLEKRFLFEAFSKTKNGHRPTASSVDLARTGGAVMRIITSFHSLFSERFSATDQLANEYKLPLIEPKVVSPQPPNIIAVPPANSTP